MDVPINLHDTYSVALSRVITKELLRISYTGKYNPLSSVVQVPDKDFKYQAKVQLQELRIYSCYYDNPIDAMNDVIDKISNLRSTHPELFL